MDEESKDKKQLSKAKKLVQWSATLKLELGKLLKTKDIDQKVPPLVFADAENVQDNIKASAPTQTLQM